MCIQQDVMLSNARTRHRACLASRTIATLAGNALRSRSVEVHVDDLHQLVLATGKELVA
jgi:hypothetical protein